MKRKIITIVVGLLLLSIYTLVVLIFSSTPGDAVTFESLQSEEVSYDAHDPYALRISRGPIQWSTLGWPRFIDLSVTRQHDDSIGHFIRSDIPLKNDDDPDVHWSSNGIEITFSLGHRLFIPKDAFVGGR